MKGYTYLLVFAPKLRLLVLFIDLIGPKENIICTMDDVRGDFFGPQHDITPAAVIANKI